MCREPLGIGRPQGLPYRRMCARARPILPAWFAVGVPRVVDIAAVMAPAAERLAAVQAVRAVAVIESHASGTADDASDIDVFVYVDQMNDDLAGARATVAADLAEPSEPPILGVTGHANTDAWILRGTETWVDAMYWTTAWAEDELDWRLIRHSPKVGYTTAFWRSIRDAIPVFERDEWHGELQRRAASAYPADLRDAIVGLNRDLIGPDNPFSFRHQADTAARRDDTLAVNNAVAKWLASYFDVLFAANRVLHPGEKRQIEFAHRECGVLPPGFATGVSELVRLSSASVSAVGERMDDMVGRLDPAIGAT